MSKPSKISVAKSVMATAALAAVLALGACTPSTLPEGLSQRMDVAGAQLNRGEARTLVNQFRASRNARNLSGDPSLDQQAQLLAQQYASSGTQPTLPEGIKAMRLSAGYPNFAETFSGWRSSTDDATAIADPLANRIGLGVAYSQNSTYGTYWIVLLDE